jgi:hypothetical protein
LQKRLRLGSFVDLLNLRDAGAHSAGVLGHRPLAGDATGQDKERALLAAAAASQADVLDRRIASLCGKLFSESRAELLKQLTQDWRRTGFSEMGEVLSQDRPAASVSDSDPDNPERRAGQ